MQKTSPPYVENATPSNHEITVILSTKKIVRTLGKIIFFLIVTGILSEFFIARNYPLPSSDWFADLFDLDSELNIPAWYQALSLLFAGVLLAIITAIKKTQKDRFFPEWKFLACLFVYMSVDEVLSIHEILIIADVREALHLPAIFYHTWVIPGAILVGLFAVKYLKFLRHLSRRFRTLFCLAGGIYIGGALITEMLSGIAVTYSIASLQFLFLIIEEGFEMLGIFIWIYALLEYIRSLGKITDLKIRILGK